MVEFAFLAPLLVALAMTLVDVGSWFQYHVSAESIVRSAARYASTHPTAWSNASTAPANTIEGIIQQEGQGFFTVANVDIANNTTSGISIIYYDALTINAGGTVLTNSVKCGSYSQSAGAFVPVGAYTQATCVKAGNFIEVDIAYTYRLQAPSPDLPVSSTVTVKCTVVEAL